MHLCNKREIDELMAAGSLEIHPAGHFLDEHRVALHLHELYEVVGDVDLRAPHGTAVERIALPDARLSPESFYLGVTRERLSLGLGLAASLHTRSRYARLGLETLQSSNFVVPGFGNAKPAPIVFEITVRRPTRGLDSEEVYCFLNVYRIAFPRTAPNTKDYTSRFPMLRRHRVGGGRQS
ncbi:dCTP deaminase domain-containing protein [Streptomyces inhibens]|uniref:dCTP deaminase domain-containing protein n=1 Tax=Streptomyces inhibens TaxID=2293571 RepID=UPI001EE698A2|nr:hypothetical protein [Streptomyces inhibens]UKY49282.1 hypothetical protein KI385_11040 [Streptomyces inhibens]